MNIVKLKLYTNTLELERAFYAKRLGFEVVCSTPKSFTVRVGWSELTFEASCKVHRYHYCFLIPFNKGPEAMEWLQRKEIGLIADNNGCMVYPLESWNATSLYFFDGSGNIAEFIVRYDLENNASAVFGRDQVLCVNEIGMPTRSIAKTSRHLETVLGTAFWKGNLTRFGTHGTQEGLFLLPNYMLKKTWFPISLGITPEPFEAVIASNGKRYAVAFKDEMVVAHEL